MESVFILSGETGEVLVEHNQPGSRSSSGAMDEFWVELNKPLYQSRPSEHVPSVLALPQCYLFHSEKVLLPYRCCFIHYIFLLVPRGGSPGSELAESKVYGSSFPKMYIFKLITKTPAWTPSST